VTIDHLGETPVYVRLAAILRARIEAGELEANRPLPSYTTLMQDYGVARGTAAKAVGVLVAGCGRAGRRGAGADCAGPRRLRQEAVRELSPRRSVTDIRGYAVRCFRSIRRSSMPFRGA
jgi:DNA-binding GntR family transcriptional regulator